jgi:hypothetical protein
VYIAIADAGTENTITTATNPVIPSIVILLSSPGACRPFALSVEDTEDEPGKFRR